MNINELWLYPESLKNASSIQLEMQQHVITRDDFTSPIKYIAGMDVSNTLYDKRKMIYAATVVLSYPDLCLLETATCAAIQKYPYVPGFLSFREAPPLVETFKKISILPDLILVDGQGICHPRGIGVATHIGILLDIPTIGVAKSILVGKAEGTLGDEVGSTIPLIWKGKELAKIVRVKKKCTPLIISSGHRVSLESAVEIVLKSIKSCKLPEPTRYAHLAANICRREEQKHSASI